MTRHDADFETAADTDAREARDAAWLAGVIATFPEWSDAELVTALDAGCLPRSVVAAELDRRTRLAA